MYKCLEKYKSLNKDCLHRIWVFQRLFVPLQAN